MNDHVGGRRNPFDAHLTGRRMEQGQQFGRAVADIFVWLLTRCATQLPTGSGIRNGLIRSRFILTPDLNARRFAQGVRRLYRFFLASRSASSTRTGPLLRTRTTCPV